MRWPVFDGLIAEKGWTDAEAARQLGISHGHLTNLRAGKSGVGKKFVDGCAAIWGAQYVYDHLLNTAEVA